MSQPSRPLSPHLQVYRWQVSNTLSILHRMTGVALSIGALALVGWLLALAAGQGSFLQLSGLFRPHLRRGRRRRRRRRACAPRSAGRGGPGWRPPASPRCSRPAATPSRRRAASAPRSATWARTTGAGTCTTPSRGRTGSATRTPSSTCARKRRPRSSSSSTTACRSRAPRTASIYQRPFGGMTTHYGKGTAQRTCAAADRTGHAMLHTLYQQSLKHEARVLHRVLRARPDHGRTASAAASSRWNLADGTLHRFRAHK
jgi:hypothetical protein